MLSDRCLYALRLMRDNDEEMVADGIHVWIGGERFSWRTAGDLRADMSVTDTSDGAGLRRFVINSTGRAILERPELADEITVALLSGEPFTIRGDRIELI